jgi:hypothetical protein
VVRRSARPRSARDLEQSRRSNGADRSRATTSRALLEDRRAWWHRPTSWRHRQNSCQRFRVSGSGGRGEPQAPIPSGVRRCNPGKLERVLTGGQPLWPLLDSCVTIYANLNTNRYQRRPVRQQRWQEAHAAVTATGADPFSPRRHDTSRTGLERVPVTVQQADSRAVTGNTAPHHRFRPGRLRWRCDIATDRAWRCHSATEGRGAGAADRPPRQRNAVAQLEDGPTTSTTIAGRLAATSCSEWPPAA